MKKLVYLLLLFIVVQPAIAQKKAQPAVTKKALSHEVYDSWKEVNFKAITADGKYAAFTINPQDGDGKVVMHDIKAGWQDSVRRAEGIVLTQDSRFVIFKIKPQQKVLKDLRRQKKKKEDLPKDSLGIYSFATRKTEKIPDVQSFKTPEKAGGWLAYMKETPKEEKTAAQGADKASAVGKPKKVKKSSAENGFTLVVRNLNDNSEQQIGFVKDYMFARNGAGLIYTSTGNDSTTKAGVYWFDTSTRQTQSLHQGKSKFRYKGLAVSEDGTQAAFLVDTDTTKALVRHVQLFHWKKGDQTGKQLDAEHSMALPMNWIISENYTPLFAKDGSKLFFGSSPQPVVQDTTLLSEEIVSVEIWGGNDDFIYPQQIKQADNERKRSYLAVIDFESKKISQLATTAVPQVEIGDEGNADIFLGESNKPYRKYLVYDPPAPEDLFIIDLKTGMQKQIATSVKGNSLLSPKANYVFWFSLPDTSWFTYHIASGKQSRLVNGKISFADETNDQPDFPSAYGVAGWTTNDEAVLVYDRYDMWSFDPQGIRQPINLTKTGRQEKTTYRYINLDPEQRTIDPAGDLLLSSFNETTRAAGYYRLSLKDNRMTKLLTSDARYLGTIKAKGANQILFTRETFREFPDVWTSDLNLAAPKKISDANPQMKNYSWGSVELVSWTSLDNIPLEGLLYKPEGFDPKKKYPMIVNFYERESENLHAHNAPQPHRSTIQKSVYTSDGYMVFIPDIVYRTGFPGESALNCILPGVMSLIAKGFVDEKNIGIQGHSWGGYQIAWMLTRSNLFKAAEAGAIVANMTSAYGGIRWESGLSRMFQYEHSQSRIGGTLWEKPMHYIENSPLFFADKIETPLLLLHNDADGAVPWYQGIEMYMALRRLEKPVWMLNYNGEPHWPVKRENRMDFQIRMKQFFDHHLKDAAMPVWMKDGVPAVEKGIKKGY
jgi:dipeptidyl aminopeptidase/acylaminoacyl peptidase